jgi:hypothetical protein
VLEGYDDTLASKALKTAVAVWNDEHSHPPAMFHSFNTTGGDLHDEEVRATVEMLLATHGGATYKQRLQALLPAIQKHYPSLGALVVQAIPFMDSPFKQALAEATTKLKASMDTELGKNPFGVPIATGTWGGAEGAVAFAVSGYYLHQAFPNIMGTDYTLRGFDYVLGRHPASNVSYVSAVGTSSNLIGYGNNRADYTFIPGGMIPGVVIIQPDFPELKSDWPFLWYENEYVVDAATPFILAANAADALSH